MNDIEIEPRELAAALHGEGGVCLLDCREDWEYETANIAGSTLIPMNSIPERVDEIPVGRPVVVICHSGRRSLNVAQWLRGRGIEARSLAGGIDRWSAEIDPTVPRY